MRFRVSPLPARNCPLQSAGSNDAPSSLKGFKLHCIKILSQWRTQKMLVAKRWHLSTFLGTRHEAWSFQMIAFMTVFSPEDRKIECGTSKKRGINAPKLSACLTGTAAWWVLIRGLTSWVFTTFFLSFLKELICGLPLICKLSVNYFDCFNGRVFLSLVLCACFGL